MWDDARTKNLVAFNQQKLKNFGIEVSSGHFKSGAAGEALLKELCALYRPSWFCPRTDAEISRTGLPLSTYFSAIKLQWMIEHHDNVRKAHEEDDLAFGTVESWIAYVSFASPVCF